MKSVGVVLMWLAASSAAISVAWTGVGVLDDDLVDPAPPVQSEVAAGELTSNAVDPGSESESNSALLSDRSTLTIGGSADGTRASRRSSTTRTTGDSASSTTDKTSTSTSTSSSTTSTTATTQTSQTTPATTQTTQTTTSTSPTTATTTVTTGFITSTTPTARVTKTFHLVGGSAAVSYSPSTIKVLWATPNPGFDVEISNSSSGRRVEFRNDDHRSRLNVWWDDGPQHEIREDD